MEFNWNICLDISFDIDIEIRDTIKVEVETDFESKERRRFVICMLEPEQTARLRYALLCKCTQSTVN